jgi:hypothetical protein
MPSSVEMEVRDSMLTYVRGTCDAWGAGSIGSNTVFVIYKDRNTFSPPRICASHIQLFSIAGGMRGKAATTQVYEVLDVFLKAATEAELNYILEPNGGTSKTQEVIETVRMRWVAASDRDIHNEIAMAICTAKEERSDEQRVIAMSYSHLRALANQDKDVVSRMRISCADVPHQALRSEVHGLVLMCIWRFCFYGCSL